MTELPNRLHPFKRGARYRVIRDFVYYGFTFTGGEVLVFVHDGYSRHDEGIVFEFLTTSGDRKDWILYDGEPVDLAFQFFEMLP